MLLDALNKLLYFVRKHALCSLKCHVVLIGCIEPFHSQIKGLITNSIAKQIEIWKNQLPKMVFWD